MIPAVTRDQMREVDRIMIEDLGIGLIQMMENAGRSLARFVVERFRPESVRVLAGSGGNGGGGMAAARHLANWGVKVTLSTSGGEPAPVPGHQQVILERMGITPTEADGADVVVDALIGYSLSGPPRGRAADLIEWSAGRTVVSLDTPSGIDVDTGEPPGAVVQAAATLTLAAPKVGLLTAAQVGDLFVADISVPPSVFASVGVAMPADLFSSGEIVPVEAARPSRGT